MKGQGTVPDDGQVEAPLQTEKRRENKHKRKGTKSQKHHNENQNVTQYAKRKNPQEKKKGTQTVKALLQDSDRQVLRFNRLTPLLEIVCHLSAERETLSR